MEGKDNVIDLKEKGDLPREKESREGLRKARAEIISTMAIIAIILSIVAFTGMVIFSLRGIRYGERLATVESLQEGMGKMVILNDVQTGLLNARIFIEENDFPRAGHEIQRIQGILRKTLLPETGEEKARFTALYRSLEELRAEIEKGPSPLTKLFRESQKKAAALLRTP